MAASKKDPEVTICPRCGWAGNKDTKPSEEDLKEFLRAVFAGRPFVKELSLYGGQVVGVFRSQNDDAIQGMNRLIRAVLNNEQTPDDIKKELCLKIKLSCYMERMAGPESVIYQCADKQPTTVEEAVDPFATMQEPVLQSAVQMLLTFLELQQKLVMHGFDDSFWKGAGLG
jgi:hypothetical protein